MSLPCSVPSSPFLQFSMWMLVHILETLEHLRWSKEEKAGESWGEAHLIEKWKSVPRAQELMGGKAVWCMLYLSKQNPKNLN